MEWESLTEANRLSELYARVSKSATTTSTSDLGAAGKLVAEQADQYMVIATKRAQMLKEVRLQMMRAETAYVSEILFDQPALFPAQEGYALSDTQHSKPTFEGPLLSAVLHRAVFPLTDQAVRESISGDALLNYVIEGGSIACGRDMEKIFLNGDTTLGTDTLAHLQLRGLDGIRKQAAAHLYDHLSGSVTDDLFDQVIQRLPSQFYDITTMKFYTSHLAALQYRRYLADRATNGQFSGDMYRAQAPELTYGGIPVIPLQLMDEAHGTNSKCTDVIFTNPKNLTLGVRDEITIEFERNARAQVTYAIFTTKFDQKIGVDDALVLAQNVKVQA